MILTIVLFKYCTLVLPNTHNTPFLHFLLSICFYFVHSCLFSPLLLTDELKWYTSNLKMISLWNWYVYRHSPTCIKNHVFCNFAQMIYHQLSNLWKVMNSVCNLCQLNSRNGYHLRWYLNSRTLKAVISFWHICAIIKTACFTYSNTSIIWYKLKIFEIKELSSIVC